MPDYIMKVAPSEDLYARYSTIVDNFTHYGTKADLMRSRSDMFAAERFDRADENGTSVRYGEAPFEGSYADEKIFIREDQLDLVGTLKRSDLFMFLYYLDTGEEDKRITLIT